MTKEEKTAKKKLDQVATSYRKVIEQFVTGKSYQPLTWQELAIRLSVIEDHFPIFQTVLDQLVADGIFISQKQRYSMSVERTDTIQGTISMHHRGFGFVEVDDKEKYPVDVFIPAHATKNAVDGDRVEISVSAIVSEKGPEGRVVSILSRTRTHLSGVVIELGSGIAHVYAPLLGMDQPVIVEQPKDQKLIIGDRIVMIVKEWGNKNDATRCELSTYMGHISDPSIDIKVAIQEFEIRKDFPNAAVEEAKVYGDKVTQQAIKERRDLRDIETFTIDPDTAKDYDDALSLTKDENGLYHLIVSIADVSHYVTPNSALDKEAFLRANSTYFPGVCVPMLPSELSDNLCSLKPKVNRLTISVFIDFNAHGEMVHYEIAKTVIKSTKRFTYKEAKKVLDGTVKSPHLETLQLMQELCLLLKKQRYNRGSVEFAMPELVILVDAEGKPTGTDYVEYDVTHQLVEEFMLKANEVVAFHLDKKGSGLPFRVHDVPSEDNMRDFSLLAGAFGFQLPNKPNPQDIQKLFDEALKTPYGQYLATSYIRRMRLAIYSPVNIGHFGLALTHYCHFTSPIRRYVDLVVHRLLFTPINDPKLLDDIANRCSERERISAKAEGSVVTLKKYRLLEKYFKEDRDREYNAIITRIKPFGIFFEILDLMLEGFIHISEIGPDYYQFDEVNNGLYGSDYGEQFASGDKITVVADEVNLLTCESKWRRLMDSIPGKKRKKNYEPRRSAKKPRRK